MNLVSLLVPALGALALAASLALPGCAAAERDGFSKRTILYGSQQQAADLYEPTPERRQGIAVLMIHGGGWSGGSRADFTDLARWLAKEGAVALSIDYRLVPHARWPAQAEDAETAMWWIREHAETLHIDPQRIVAIGGSAGGHLVAWLGTTNHVNARGTPSRANRIVSLWGPWDLTAPNIREDGRSMVSALVGARAPREASPLFLVDAQSAPTLLIHGTRDELVPFDQSTRACEALKAAKVQCDLIALEGEGHGFTSPQADPTAALLRLKEFIAAAGSRR